MELENSAYPQEITEQQREEIFNLGKEFAFEGLDENDFIHDNPYELVIFREGFKEGLKLQQGFNNEHSEHSHLRR
ncbi:MAG: hypothetical protein ACI4XM_00735 [Candidatus Coprovivens sp.]